MKNLIIKNFKIKAESKSFSSTRFMTDLEKKKIYVDFVKFLNNHFKRTTFSKKLYEHFHQHCGFTAHYNIDGFYGEYFMTAAKFHKLHSGYENFSEYTGHIAIFDGDTASSAFADIYYEMMNGSASFDSLNGFFSNMFDSISFDEYEDLNRALKGAWIQYVNEFYKLIDIAETLNEEETIKEEKTVVYEHKENKKEENNLEKPVLVGTQGSLFDFL